MNPPRAGHHLLLIFATVAWTCLAILPWITKFGPLPGGPDGILAALVVTAVPGVLLFAASRRSEQSSRLRLALLFFALSMLLTAGGNFLRLLDALGVSLPSVAGLGVTTTVMIWALGLAALLLLPLAPLTRGGEWRIVTDITIAGVGLALVIFVIWGLPGLRIAPPAMRLQITLYNVMEAANLIVLSLILVRGPHPAIRRAVWWLSATIVIETMYLVALQYAIGRQTHDLRLVNSLFFLDYLAYLYAAVLFLRTPLSDTDEPFAPEIIRAINPLPMLAVLGVGALLILSALGHPDTRALPLAIGIVVMSLLLLARVGASTFENLRLLREEATEDRRRQSEKLEMVGRLAGGIAHVINNLMSVVVMNADLAQMRSIRNQSADDNLKAIGGAAMSASALAERLLLASGRRLPHRELKRLAEVVRLQQESVIRSVGPERKVIWELADGDDEPLVNPSELEVILRELVSNAVEATPPGGTITIRVRGATLLLPPAGMTPTPTPGRYSVLEVEDTGHGLAPADLSRIVEPFFTTRPLHEGRGLGLSVVHGLVSSHGGGLLIDTVPEGGARVSVYLPTTPDIRLQTPVPRPTTP